MWKLVTYAPLSSPQLITIFSLDLPYCTVPLTFLYPLTGAPVITFNFHRSIETWIILQRPNLTVPEFKENRVVWDPKLELTIISPYVISRVNSNTFTIGNPLPESTLTLCFSRLYPPISDKKTYLFCWEVLCWNHFDRKIQQIPSQRKNFNKNLQRPKDIKYNTFKSFVWSRKLIFYCLYPR